MGGLGFLSLSVQGFLILAAAHGALLASLLADRILHFGASLQSFAYEIAALVVFVLGIALLPLFVFTGQLAAAKRRGQEEFGTLATRYVRDFDAKWLRGGAPPDEPLIGSSDIQSLADLSGSIEVVNGMRMAPITRNDVLTLIAVTLLPIAPLLLTVMPVDALARGLLGVLF